jgi:hypothetical protein
MSALYSIARRVVSSLLIFLGLSAAQAAARDLFVEVAVLHIGGLLTPAELDTMLAAEGLTIEAHYSPTRLIEGVTATRQRVMPLGTRLFAIPRSVNIKGSEIEREDRVLRFRLADIPPGHDHYRLTMVRLEGPLASGRGRPQPYLSIDLLQEPPRPGAHETAVFVRQNVFDVGLRLRYRWSDAKGPAVPSADRCHPDIQALGSGAYRFRPRHRLAGFFTVLASDAQSDPPSRPRAGQRSLRMTAPYPEPVNGWQLSRNHLIRMEIDGHTIERFSVYGEQPGPGQCRRTRGYEALFGDGQLVELQRSIHDYGCSAEQGSNDESVQASWLDDKSLGRYLLSSGRGTQEWDAFAASRRAECGETSGGSAPQNSSVDSLTDEFHRLREAFLRN